MLVDCIGNIMPIGLDTQNIPSISEALQIHICTQLWEKSLWKQRNCHLDDISGNLIASRHVRLFPKSSSVFTTLKDRRLRGAEGSCMTHCPWSARCMFWYLRGMDTKTLTSGGLPLFTGRGHQVFIFSAYCSVRNTGLSCQHKIVELLAFIPLLNKIFVLMYKAIILLICPLLRQ